MENDNLINTSSNKNIPIHDNEQITEDGQFSSDINFKEQDEKRDQSEPRDGMSSESAIFQIGKRIHKQELRIDGVENKGRYYIAKILDKRGKAINEIMVDKLNGRVKFIR